MPATAACEKHVNRGLRKGAKVTFNQKRAGSRHHHGQRGHTALIFCRGDSKKCHFIQAPSILVPPLESKKQGKNRLPHLPALRQKGPAILRVQCWGVRIHSIGPRPQPLTSSVGVGGWGKIQKSAILHSL